MAKFTQTYSHLFAESRYIYIYAFSRCFYPKQLTGYTFFYEYALMLVCFVFYSQTDLLGVCCVRQQRPSARIRSLFPTSACSAGRKPVFHWLGERTGGGVSRDSAHYSCTPKAEVVGLKTASDHFITDSERTKTEGLNEGLLTCTESRNDE